MFLFFFSREGERVSRPLSLCRKDDEAQKETSVCTVILTLESQLQVLLFDRILLKQLDLVSGKDD